MVITPDTIDDMTDTELTDTVSAQFVASEAEYRAVADAAPGQIFFAIMPGETTARPRALTLSELAGAAATNEYAGAIHAQVLTLLETAGEGDQVVIAQGASFQMTAFIHTWSS